MIFRSLEDTEIQFAYNSIHDFFDFFELNNALYNIETMLRSAISSKPWSKAAPSGLILLNEKLEKLSAAAFSIYSNNGIRNEAVLKEDAEPDMNMPEYFVGRYITCTVWNCFPRSLTIKQFNNPYKAIKKFTSYMTEQEWKQTFKDLTEYALSNYGIEERYPPYNVLTMRLRLLQLIEACYLIEVRTVIKAAPASKPKKKKQSSI